MSAIPNDARLVDAARRGDRHAREQIVVDHLPIIRTIAVRYRNLGLSVDDLLQEGSVGLLEAIDLFDPRRSDDFEAYARFRIRRAIRNALTEQSRLIRLPKQIVERRRAIERAEAVLKGATGRAPTPDELAAATGLSRSAVLAARGAGGAPVSLDVRTIDDGSTLEEVIADQYARDPEAEVELHERTRMLERALAALPRRQQVLIQRHFGLGTAPEQLAAVAVDLHVSEQRARELEQAALYALQEKLDPTVKGRAQARRDARAGGGAGRTRLTAGSLRGRRAPR